MPQKKNIQHNCKHCNKEFFVTKQAHQKNLGLYCSNSCSAYDRAGTKRSEVYTTLECAHCKTEFERRKSKLSNSKSGMYFCSKEHKNISQQIGGIKEIQPSHYGEVPSKYRKLAFRLKEAKCELCSYNKFTEILEVHHLDKDRTNNTIENLQILCPNCHRITHMGLI